MLPLYWHYLKFYMFPSLRSSFDVSMRAHSQWLEGFGGRVEWGIDAASN